MLMMDMIRMMVMVVKKKMGLMMELMMVQQWREL